MAPVLTIRLFGVFECLLAGAPLPGLHLRDGERLLAFLTLRHGTTLSYRQLAQQFWPSEARQHDEYEGGSYPSTRQGIYALRRALREESWRLGSPNKGVVCLDLTGADVDLVRFEQLVQRNDSDSLRQAIDLYRAPLLERWPEAWAREAQARCQRSYDRARAELAKLPATPAVSTIPAPETDPGEKLESETLGSNEARSNEAVSAELGLEEMRLEAVGGAVPLESRFYIERPTDGEFLRAIARQDSIVLVKGARQIGKTSLLARGLQRARESGRRVFLTDLQSFSEAELISPGTLYRAIVEEMVDQLALDADLDMLWNERRSANRNLERFLREVVLGAGADALVWGLDEVDRLFACPFAGEVFGLFRSWHNRRALEPDGPWSRLTLAMAYATEAHLFITDTNQSPFNVGTRLELSDFTFDQVSELNRRHKSPLRDEAEIRRFVALLGGQPYLIRRGLAEMTAREMDVSALEQSATKGEGPFGDHLRRLMAALLQDAESVEMLRKVLHRELPISLNGFYRLRSAGLVTGSSASDAHPRCQLYATYFSQPL